MKGMRGCLLACLALLLETHFFHVLPADHGNHNPEKALPATANRKKQNSQVADCKVTSMWHCWEGQPAAGVFCDLNSM